MPLTHLLPTAACLLAAAVMLVHAHDRVSRAAHLVMLAAMVALCFWMTSRVAVVAIASVLCAVGFVVLRRGDHPRRATAIDSVACAAMLVAAAWSMTGMGHRGGSASGAMSGTMSGTMSGAMDMSAQGGGTGSPLLVVVTVLLGWIFVSWFLTPRRSPLGWGAGALMLAGMGAMSLV